MDSPAGEKGGDREEEMEIKDIYSLHSIDSEHRFLFLLSGPRWWVFLPFSLFFRSGIRNLRIHPTCR